jgi:hypothetical protein
MVFCGTAPSPSAIPGVVRRVVQWRSVRKITPQPPTIVTHTTPPPVATPAADPIELCRQARRLRASYGHDPVQMHRQLSQLSLADKPAEPLPPAIPEDEEVWPLISGEQAFRRLVERTLSSDHFTILRYSQRLSLLKEAVERGITRFDANLIIASVEHQLINDRPDTTADLNSWRLSVWVMFATLQSLITAGVWRLIKA